MILYILLGIVAIFVYFKYIKRGPEDYEILSPFYGDKFWTKGEEVVDTEIRPFEIKISDAELEDLNKRLQATRFPTPALKDSKFTYGVNGNFMRNIVEYWKNEYDWRKQETELNKFAHFKTKIEGLDIHFIHLRPKTMSTANQPRPVMLIHGWPGSFFEFYKMIPMLIDPTSHGGNETDLFEVIVPSIPGYGFSQPAEVKGFGSLNCARIFHKLMLRLGHKKYYVQGGDWGSLISTQMSMLYPSAVKGQHFSMYTGGTSPLTYLKIMIGSIAPNVFFDAEDAKKQFPLKNVFFHMLQETGYFHLQTTKPDTVGFSLTDSPVGLAAYILEKFSTWTNPDGKEKDDGDILKYWTCDELLNNIMIYWWSGNITSSMRFYKEAMPNAMTTQNVKVRVPAGFAWFPHELSGTLKSQVEFMYKRLVSFTRMKDGGHFSAFQVPELLTEDFRNFIRKIENVKDAEAFREAEYEKDFKQTHLDRFET